MEFLLPYGKEHIACSLPDTRIAGILRGSGEAKPEKPGWDLVADAMAAPYGGKTLKELAAGKQHIVLIASDHTRPVPSKLIVPQMLREIREGNPEATITILIATGCHRETTAAELTDKFGADLVANERIVIHDCEDAANLVTLGTLPSGGSLQINRLAAEADLLVAEGFIEPHFFAGFSGGRKSVLPGIASRVCVHYNHNSAFMDDPKARTGILEGNPIHRDMLYAAQTAKLAYIVNVVLNAEGQVVAAFAGDPTEAHAAGTAFVSARMGCKAIPADIVITTNNGYPLDQNAYQMVKGMTAGEATCRDGGVIIAVGKCNDGIGGDSFLKLFRECDSIPALLRRFRETPAEETLTDQWQAHIFARILEHYTVIFVSELSDDLVRDLHMIPAKSVEEALTLADSVLKRNDASITVIPEGISVIVLPD